MINRDLIEIFIELAREKNIERSELGTIIEQLFLFIIEKETGEADNCSVIVNLDKGEIEIYVEKTIVEEVDDDHFDITLERAVELEPDLAGELKLGDTFVEVIDPARFGRRLVANARQFLNKRTREVQQQYIYEDYVQRIGEVIIGTVHQVHRENTFVNIEQTELRMPRNEQIFSERFRRGDTIRALVKAVEVTPKGPDILISRSDDLFLYKLFEMEVPEIEDGIIEIKGIARKPGERSKIIVHSVDKRIDAVGACVGMRGSRVQSVSNELNGERIDIILWSENSAQFVVNAMSPANVVSIVVDEENQSMDIAVEEAKLSQAIGKGGQNIRLASELTQWKLNVLSETEALEKDDEELQKITDLFVESLSVGDDVAILLAQEGFTTIEQVAYVPVTELQKIEGFDETLVNELRERAQDQLLLEAISTEENLEEHGPSDDLLALDTVSEEIAYSLARGGINTKNLLAEQSVDELLEIEGIDEEAASAMILEAREDWFKEGAIES